MGLTIQTQNPDIANIQTTLAGALHDTQVKVLNRKTIMVSQGKVMTIVRLSKNRIKIQGDLNTKDPVNLILIVLGIILGLIGVFFIFGILYIIYFKSMKRLRHQVYSTLGGA
jgi:uncharacterized membrane protein